MTLVGDLPSHPTRLRRVAERLRDHGRCEYVAMRASSLDDMALELERLAWQLERVGCDSGSAGPPF